MRKYPNNPRLMHFLSLPQVARQMGCDTKKLVADLRPLTHRERREVADLVQKGG